MIKTILVDDEPIALKHLSGMIEKCSSKLEIIATATTVKKALEQFSLFNPELVFLDIELAGKQSFEILDKQNPRNYEVIFVTAHNQFGIQALKHGALDYILKPLNKTELCEAIEKAAKKIYATRTGSHTSSNNHATNPLLTRLAVPTMDGLVFVDINKILYLESDGRYTRFHMLNNEKSILVSKNLGEYENNLTSHQFVRIHHHSIVNINYIEKYIKGRGGYVILTGGINLPVSSGRKSAFFDKLG